MSALKFVCPICGDTNIEEVVNDTTAYNWITIDKDGNYVDTLETRISGGWLSRFQCVKSGHEVKWPNGDPIFDTEGLAEYLLEQGNESKD